MLNFPQFSKLCGKNVIIFHYCMFKKKLILQNYHFLDDYIRFDGRVIWVSNVSKYYPNLFELFLLSQTKNNFHPKSTQTADVISNTLSNETFYG